MLLRFEQTVPLPPAALFAFFGNPGNIPLLYRHGPRVRVLRHQGHVRPGAQTWVEIVLAGILPVVMGFEHDLYDPPRRFGEHIIHGPFRRFTHVHEFDPAGNGTLVRDLVDVEVRACYGGGLMLRALAPFLRGQFAGRAESLNELVRDGAVVHEAKPDST